MSCWFPERLAASYSRGNRTFRIIGDRLVHCLRISLGRAADRGHGRRLRCRHVAKRRACSRRIGNVRVIRGKEHRVYRVPNRRSPRETHVLFLTSQGASADAARGAGVPASGPIDCRLRCRAEEYVPFQIRTIHGSWPGDVQKRGLPDHGFGGIPPPIAPFNIDTLGPTCAQLTQIVLLPTHWIRPKRNTSPAGRARWDMRDMERSPKHVLDNNARLGQTGLGVRLSRQERHVDRLRFVRARNDPWTGQPPIRRTSPAMGCDACRPDGLPRRRSAARRTRRHRVPQPVVKPRVASRPVRRLPGKA